MVEPRRPSIPLWVKVVYTLWLAVWVPLYWQEAGPYNFFWLCDTGNFLVGMALWLESPLLFSSQAVGLLLVQLLWCVDYFGALVLGFHPLGGTEYMFDGAKPIWLRSLSLFHVVMPPLLVWGVRRLGYDRRGFALESAFAALLLPATWWIVPAERNVNWVWEPFGRPQTLVDPWLYLLVLLAAYPLLVFLPTHLLLTRWARTTAGPPELLPRATRRPPPA